MTWRIKTLDIYKGDFLPADTSCLWTFSLRERLRNRFIRVMLLLGCRLEWAGQWLKVIELYESAIGIDDLAEEFYLHLMVCYQRINERMSAKNLYEGITGITKPSFFISFFFN